MLYTNFSLMRNSTFRMVCFLSIGILCNHISYCANTDLPKDFIALTSQQDTLNFYLEVNGSIRQMKNVMGDSGDKPWLDSAIVTVYYNNTIYTKAYTTRRGKCTFQLALDKNYIVELSKPGFVSKRFEVNTKTPSNKKDAYSFYFDMDIFEYIEGLDTKVLDKPIAIVHYNVTNNEFEYDAAFTNRINNDLKLMYRNYYLLEHDHKKKKK